MFSPETCLPMYRFVRAKYHQWEKGDEKRLIDTFL